VQQLRASISTNIKSCMVQNSDAPFRVSVVAAGEQGMQTLHPGLASVVWLCSRRSANKKAAVPRDMAPKNGTPAAAQASSQRCSCASEEPATSATWYCSRADGSGGVAIDPAAELTWTRGFISCRVSALAAAALRSGRGARSDGIKGTVTSPSASLYGSSVSCNMTTKLQDALDGKSRCHTNFSSVASRAAQPWLVPATAE